MPVAAEVSWDELVAALRLEAHMGKRGQQIPRFRGVGRVAGDHARRIAVHVAGSACVPEMQGASGGAKIVS